MKVKHTIRHIGTEYQNLIEVIKYILLTLLYYFPFSSKVCVEYLPNEEYLNIIVRAIVVHFILFVVRAFVCSKAFNSSSLPSPNLIFLSRGPYESGI